MTKKNETATRHPFEARDLRGFAEGTHDRLYERLGAHPTSFHGADGVRFAGLRLIAASNERARHQWETTLGGRVRDVGNTSPFSDAEEKEPTGIAFDLAQPMKSATMRK